MVNTWKLKGRGKVDDKTVISSEYFIENNCVSCGWGDPALKFKEYVKDFQTYKEKWFEMYGREKKWGYQGVHQLFESVKKGDFLWTRLNGEYYVAQVPANPIDLFHIDYSDSAAKHDCIVQLNNIKWNKYGTEDTVPGSISSYTRNTNSIVKVDNREVVQNGHTATSMFSARLFDSGFNELIRDRKMIFNFIGPSGFEDLIALWLYDKFNYVVIPSTNKMSTQKYEFVLVDGSRKGDQYNCTKRIYLQAKNGNNDLRFSDYVSLLTDDRYEVWLVTSGGKVYGITENLEHHQMVRFSKFGEKYDSLSFDMNNLIDFVFDKTKQPILPESVSTLTTLFE